MASNNFNAKLIENLKPKDKPYIEREKRGFAIRVLPTSVKTWIFIYTIHGKRKWYSLGQYPGMSLKDARKAYVEAYNMYQQGKDPSLDRKKEKEADTVGSLVEKFIERGLKQKGNRSWREYKRNLDKDVLPVWEHRKAKDISRDDVLNLLEKIIDRGAKNQSNQVLKIIRRMFNFALERGLVEYNPCANLKPLVPIVQKDRTLSDTEIKTFWHGLDNAYMDDEIKRALKLILVTAQRPGEVIGSHASEIDGDWWTIPAKRSKNKKAHKVFLTPLAKELFQVDKGGLLFPTPRPKTDKQGKLIIKPIEVNAVAKALRRTLRGIKKKDGTTIEPAIKMQHFTPHDLRRTAASNMASLGFGVIVDKVLNHTDQRVTAIYDRYDYAKEKQIALEALSRKIDSIVIDETTDNVIPLRK